MGNIGAWDFCTMAAQCINRLAGQAIYRAIGQRVIYKLQLLCSDNGAIVRYPSDTEILEVIDAIKKEMTGSGSI